MKPIAQVAQGKKTYALIGSAVAAVAISVAARHGLDLGDYGPDIAAGVGALLLTGAAWARSVVAPQPIDEQDRITPRGG